MQYHFPGTSGRIPLISRGWSFWKFTLSHFEFQLKNNLISLPLAAVGQELFRPPVGFWLL
tara:strand:- start:124869 stop:125048 length:180 start_codon:yes stop_codon:yes gene_type:complete